jgi:hypothetical protein
MFGRWEQRWTKVASEGSFLSIFAALPKIWSRTFWSQLPHAGWLTGCLVTMSWLTPGSLTQTVREKVSSSQTVRDFCGSVGVAGNRGGTKPSLCSLRFVFLLLFTAPKKVGWYGQCLVFPPPPRTPEISRECRASSFTYFLNSKVIHFCHFGCFGGEATNWGQCLVFLRRDHEKVSYLLAWAQKDSYLLAWARKGM